MSDGVLFAVTANDVVSVGAFVLQMGCVFGALMIGYGRLDQRLKTVEAHAEAVQRIGSIEARFEQFERGMEARLENIERAVREAAAATQALALAFAQRKLAG